MRHLVRIAALGLIVMLVAVPGAAIAVEVIAGDAPAVEAPADTPDEREEPWTSRFLAPAVLVLGVVALGGSVLYYGVRVRARYRVVR